MTFVESDARFCPSTVAAVAAAIAVAAVLYYDDDDDDYHCYHYHHHQPVREGTLEMLSLISFTTCGLRKCSAVYKLELSRLAE